MSEREKFLIRRMEWLSFWHRTRNIGISPQDLRACAEATLDLRDFRFKYMLQCLDKEDYRRITLLYIQRFKQSQMDLSTFRERLGEDPERYSDEYLDTVICRNDKAQDVTLDSIQRGAAILADDYERDTEKDIKLTILRHGRHD